jgi:hypothetical protein
MALPNNSLSTISERGRLLSQKWGVLVGKAGRLTAKDLAKPDPKDPTIEQMRKKDPARFDETFNLLCDKVTSEILKLCLFWGYNSEKIPSQQKLSLFIAKVIMQNENWLRLSHLAYITYSLSDCRIKLGGVVHRLPERNKFQLDPDWLSDCFENFRQIVFNLQSRIANTVSAPAAQPAKTLTAQNYADTYAAGVLAVLGSAKEAEAENEYPVFYNAMIRAEKLFDLLLTKQADPDALSPILAADTDALTIFRQLELADKNMDKLIDKSVVELFDIFIYELKTDFFADFVTLYNYLFAPVSDIVSLSQLFALYSYAKNCNYREPEGGQAEF